MTPSGLVVSVCLGFLAGVVFASLNFFSWSLLLLFLVFLTFLFLLSVSDKKSVKILLFFIILLSFSIGFLRFNFYHSSNGSDEAVFFQDFRSVLIQKSSQVISDPEKSIISAMVLGNKKDLSKETKEIFNRTGTRHVLAISGLHLAIVASLIFDILIIIGLWRSSALWFSLLGILSFVLLVGSPPSAVRAGIMAGLYLLAKGGGRLGQSLHLLLIAATIMTLFNPTLIVSSVGFQLSFLAVAGIVIFKPFLDKVFKFIKPKILRNLINLSLSAQITTWPILIFNFGEISTVGLIANVFVVPLLPIIMILGLGFIIFGWTSVLLAKIFLWPAWVLSHLILSFNLFLSKFKFSLIEIESLNPVFILLYYSLLLLVFYLLKNRSSASLSL